jgi:DNA-binding XRE family transcriptional regulator
MANKLSERITYSRKLKGFKQKELASILKVSLPTMNHYESGKRSPNSELPAKDKRGIKKFYLMNRFHHLHSMTLFLYLDTISNLQRLVGLS